VEIIVLRYGHRDVRDYRVTTHCALVSRALGANKIIICGEKDESVTKTVDDVTARWGGPFKVEWCDAWKPEVKRLKKKGFVIVHLTMYGLSVEEVTAKGSKLSKSKKVCAIIGSQKVERAVYEAADYNVGVAQQPHSEIAALAVFLDRIQQGKGLSKKFKGADRRIIPQERGKKVIGLKKSKAKKKK